MPDFAEFVPYVVPFIAGVLVLRLLLDLLRALGQRGEARVRAVRSAWGRFTLNLFYGAFLTPVLAAFLNLRLNPMPLWVLLLVGGVGAALHTSLMAGRGKALGQGQPGAGPAPAAPPPQRRSAAGKERRQAAVSPAAPSLAVQRLDSAEQAIAKLPYPPARVGREMPLPSEQAEAWAGRQEARLEHLLQGRELAAAKLRLSTVKSLLLLGQIGPSEADQDVDMVLRQAGRG